MPGGWRRNDGLMDGDNRVTKSGTQGKGGEGEAKQNKAVKLGDRRDILCLLKCIGRKVFSFSHKCLFQGRRKKGRKA